MRPRDLARLFAGYVFLVVSVALGVRAYVALRPLGEGERTYVTSSWQKGKLVARDVARRLPTPSTPDRVTEVAVAEGPMWSSPFLFALALVPRRDGIFAELDGRTAWLTVDDLLALQAYDRGTTFIDASLLVGTHRSLVLSVLAERLGANPADVASSARLRRVRFERIEYDTPLPARGPDIDEAHVTAAIKEAASYLARNVDADGRFRYAVRATTNTSPPGYNWPRHAGATYFLAEAAALLDDPDIRFACLRAAAAMRDEHMLACGSNTCIADDDSADVGSSALALLAFSEIVRTGADASYRRSVVALAAFLRAQQRPDGEMMHRFDRNNAKAVNVQYPYFTGEAALALSRAHRITNDPADLRASSRALAYLTTRAWNFFGSRYFFAEEHWTCQATADLWDRAPDAEALAFCLRWHDFQRSLQYREGETAFDADGAFGFGPLTPRVTPASSRGEAAGAALEILRRDPSRAPDDVALALDDELMRATAFVMRRQLRPGPRHLFADPDAVRGGMPASAVDWELRIDSAQHAGSMMIRFLKLRRFGLLAAAPTLH